MATSPDELRKKTFAVVPKGYDRPEVNKYLATLAEELEKFNGETATAVSTDEESVDAVSAGLDNRPAEATPRVEKTTTDDFDRVGNEISLMLRQAQESAMKIRDDAEIEARTLVDQVRLDIEADRVAHEQAAAELISRTEERATSIRVSAEDYSRETRETAEQMSETRRAAIEAELADSITEAATARQRTHDQLAAASAEAEATLLEAKNRAAEIITHAETDAQSRSDELLSQARASLQNLMEAETRTRHDLEQARRGIKTVLDQLSIAELDQGFGSGYTSGEQEAS